jgi:hypothetical protein
MKSGNLNFLELSGPLQACNGTAALPLPFTLLFRRFRKTTLSFVVFISFEKLGCHLKDFRNGILRGIFVRLCHIKMGEK